MSMYNNISNVDFLGRLFFSSLRLIKHGLSISVQNKLLLLCCKLSLENIRFNDKLFIETVLFYGSTSFCLNHEDLEIFRKQKIISLNEL